MTVYVVSRGEDYRDSWVIGVFDHDEKAIECVERAIDGWDDPFSRTQSENGDWYYHDGLNFFTIKSHEVE